MTAQELIELLSVLPPRTRVVTSSDYGIHDLETTEIGIIATNVQGQHPAPHAQVDPKLFHVGYDADGITLTRTTNRHTLVCKALETCLILK